MAFQLGTKHTSDADAGEFSELRLQCLYRYIEMSCVHNPHPLKLDPNAVDTCTRKLRTENQILGSAAAIECLRWMIVNHFSQVRAHGE
jgi:hypothetical protein